MTDDQRDDLVVKARMIEAVAGRFRRELIEEHAMPNYQENPLISESRMLWAVASQTSALRPRLAILDASLAPIRELLEALPSDRRHALGVRVVKAVRKDLHEFGTPWLPTDTVDISS